MPGYLTRLHESAIWQGKQRARMQRADSLLDAISVCLNAHIHGASAFSLDDIARSIVREIRCYRGQEFLPAEVRRDAGRRPEAC
jgi:hypothetical protein